MRNWVVILSALLSLIGESQGKAVKTCDEITRACRQNCEGDDQAPGEQENCVNQCLQKFNECQEKEAKRKKGHSVSSSRKIDDLSAKAYGGDLGAHFNPPLEKPLSHEPQHVLQQPQ